MDNDDRNSFASDPRRSNSDVRELGRDPSEAEGMKSRGRQVSGLYVTRRKERGATWSVPALLESVLGGEAKDAPERESRALPAIGAENAFAIPWVPLAREEMRLDVDDRYPQMTASGTIRLGHEGRLHWIASLDAVRWPGVVYQGPIWLKDGDASLLPHTHVLIIVPRGLGQGGSRAHVIFRGGAALRHRAYEFCSPSFRQVEFEYDAVEGTQPVTEIRTHAHDNRPEALPDERLSIEQVFSRTGFDVRARPRGHVPLEAAQENGRWSDAEMHDAMQAHWSRFADREQWSMWVLFASLHDRGASLGGVMFDDIGPNHRQGTAIFNDSFISQAPNGEAQPAEWVARMRFWTAVHEMGHAFNLAHSWQKALGTPWVGLSADSEARSFMNYPYFVEGGERSFFSNFEYRFSDPELLFMRHAPERYVQMGNADWFDHHGLRNAQLEQSRDFKLEARLNRGTPELDFLEPAVIELKLTNTGNRVQVLDASLLAAHEEMTVIVKREHQPAKQWLPYARYCERPAERVLKPGQSMYGSLFVGAGRTGWLMAEPGHYTVQVAIEKDGSQIVSAPLRLRVRAPKKWEHERLAQDFFNDDVGRVLRFDGSRTHEAALDTLREAREQCADERVAIHAEIPLLAPRMKGYKVLSEDHALHVAEPEPEPVRSGYESLLENGQASAEALGHIDFKDYMEQYATWLAEQDPESGKQALQSLRDTLSSRGVLPEVLDELQGRIDGEPRGQAAAE